MKELAVRCLYSALVVVSWLATSARAESWCDAAPLPVLAALTQVDSGEDWFKIYVVADGVFAITEPRQAEGVNSFLIVGSRRAILFDSGLGVGRIGKVVSKLTPLPVTVLNSHTHFDHVGGNAEFADVRNLNIPYSLASSRGQVDPALAEYARPTLAEDRVCGPLPTEVTSREYKIPTWRISRYIEDNERIDLGSRTLEVLRTPGHTPDSMTLLDRARGLLFTGDTYYSNQIYLWAPGTDLGAYRASIDRLVALRPGLKALLPAHGAPTADPEQLVELQTALREIVAGSAPSTPAPQNRRVFRFEHFSILMAQPPETARAPK
ncbi:MBL fold metallo-hydrolase [Steroidobacter flavus]|uniref:MBL fold metallo-hydrolase n=1 Tax=Steroidobacter flavus TaxID=1842136 RepID=A0ABV8SWN4_9GAMM